MKIVVTTLNAKYIHTCLALRLLKAYARPEFNLNISEYTLKDPDMNVVQDLYAQKPDIIGFSCYIWNIEKTIQIISMLKKVMPETVFVLGGPEVSYDTFEWMERIPEADYIVRGEGEDTFKQLLHALKDDASPEKIGGIAYREDNQIKLTPSNPNLDISKITTPYRFEEDLPALKNRIVYFETSRGCPFQCQFCLSSIEVGVRYFDIENVKNDLLYLIGNGAKMIKFIDRTFNINRDYAMEIFRFLIDNHSGCQFQFEITADIMRPEVLEFLNREAPPGIFRFEIGVQSTNDDTNILVKRKQNFKKLSRTVNLIKQGGKIDQHLDLIAGLPEEDYSSFRKTFNDVFAMRPEELQLGFLKMLRGTGMRATADKYNYTYMDHAPYEILSNNVLPFDDVIKIKQVEDILEKYWNNHHLDHTVEYITEHVFETPFDFFQNFGSYWDKQGWGKIGHQFEDLFTRLRLFLNEFHPEALTVTEGLMKLDYLLHFRQKPRKTWWHSGVNKEVLTGIRLEELKGHDSLKNYLENSRALSKHIIAEKMSFNAEHYLEQNEIIPSEGLMFAVYDPKQPSTSIYFVEKEAVSSGSTDNE